MDNQELKNKIYDFCIKKNFSNPFFKECLTEFIEGHTKLYGDIISEDELFERLDSNLDKITFSEKATGMLGEYKGRVAENTDQNEIFLYFKESDLESPELTHKAWDVYTESDKAQLLEEFAQKKDLIKSTLIHEMTHAAYTVKDRYGLSENHVFSTISQNYDFNEFRKTAGTYTFIEPIINYISSRIQGKNPDEIQTYPAQTKAVFILAEKMDENKIIKSAWNSDLDLFKYEFNTSLGFNKEEGNERFNRFEKLLKKLDILNTRDIPLSQKLKEDDSVLSKIDNVFDNTKELEDDKPKFNKPSITSPLQETPITSIVQYKEPTFFEKIVNSVKSKLSNIKNSLFKKNDIDEMITSINPFTDIPEVQSKKEEPLPPWDLRNWSEEELKKSAEQEKKEQTQKSNSKNKKDNSITH